VGSTEVVVGVVIGGVEVGSSGRFYVWVVWVGMVGGVWRTLRDALGKSLAERALVAFAVACSLRFMIPYAVQAKPEQKGCAYSV